MAARSPGAAPIVVEPERSCIRGLTLTPYPASPGSLVVAPRRFCSVARGGLRFELLLQSSEDLKQKCMGSVGALSE